MLIDFAIEKWESFWPNFESIWYTEHQPELYEGENSRRLNHLSYAIHEMQNRLLIVTARHERKLVGYFVVLLISNIPFLDTEIAHAVFYYVLKAYRHRGIFSRLLAMVEESLAVRRVDTLYISTKLATDMRAVLEKSGFKSYELTLRKDYVWLQQQLL